MALYKLDNSITTSGAIKGQYSNVEILASGEYLIEPRDQNVSLTSTNIGYWFNVQIAHGLDAQYLQEGVTVLVDCVTKYKDASDRYETYSVRPMDGGGDWYNDGTNRASFVYDYNMTAGYVELNFKVRQTAGTVTFNPHDYFYGYIQYKIINKRPVSLDATAIGGVPGSGDSKYYFLDYIKYDSNGNILVPLSQSTLEFVDGNSNWFPKVKNADAFTLAPGW